MSAAGAAQHEPRPESDAAVPARLDCVLAPEAASRLGRVAGWRALGLRGGRWARLVEIWHLGAESEANGAGPGAARPPEGLVFGGVIGRRRRYVSRAVPGLGLTIASGAFVAGAGGGRLCRLSLTGPALAVAAAARGLAEDLPLAALPVPLPAFAAHRALGVALPPPADPTAELDAATPLTLAASRILAARAAVLRAHLAALSGVPVPASADHDPEPVHQTRVALRRLRAAIAAFAPLCAPMLAELRQTLRAFGRVLGPAREWDVFMGGIGRDLTRAFPEDPAPLRLLPAAIARWHAAYAALGAWLAGDAARQLDVMLAILPLLVLPPGEGEAAPAFGAFARDRLERRARKLRRVTTLADLGPELLHRLRLDAKRLRYLGEIFAPCFPPRRVARFLRRLAALQDRLGAINDVATTARQVRELAPEIALAADVAPDFAVAQGMALGLAAAGVPRATRKAARALQRLQALKPFWG